MIEKDPSWLHLIPFMLTTGQSQKLSVQRITEAVIIAAITAGVATYAGQQVLTERLSGLRVEVQSVKQSVQEINRKVEQLRNDLYVPAGRGN